MGEKLNVTELDYQQIKDNLISYFENVTDENGNKIYQDYDFKGSALNTLIGILAYNTHYNAMTAHMAINESFIDSAQLRSSVVSAAKLLGYVPRSATAAKAEVTLEFTQANNDPPQSITLDRNSLFKTTYNDRTYYFVPQDGATLTLEDGVYKSHPDNNIILLEGQRVTKRFQVSGQNDFEKYVIDDENVDTSTLVVRVYPNPNNFDSAAEYVRYTDILTTSPDARLYYLAENSLGKYELSFGNNIISKKLDPLNVIEIEYLITNGDSANGARGPFTLASTTSSDINLYTAAAGRLVIVQNYASGGGQKESIESVRINSTSGFVSQNRAVTADDYRNIILSGLSSANSVSVWGGEDNDPPQYGKVFVCVQKKGVDEPLTSTEKTTLKDLLTRKKVLAIIPEIVDAEYVNIVLDVLFKYNSNITSSTRSQLETIVRNEVIDAYNDNNLNGFGKIFRHSEFTKKVDNVRSAILNSHVRVFLSKTFSINPNSYDQLRIKYGTELTVDDGRAIASFTTGLTTWTYENERIYVADKEDPTSPDKRILYTYAKNSDGSNKIILDNVGTITLSSGILTLSTLGISDNPFTLTIDLIPISDDVVSRRNQIVTISQSRCNVIGYVDEIEVGGESRAINYQTFKRDR